MFATGIAESDTKCRAPRSPPSSPSTAAKTRLWRAGFAASRRRNSPAPPPPGVARHAHGNHLDHVTESHGRQVPQRSPCHDKKPGHPLDESTQRSAAPIFICYRRSNGAHAARIHDWLASWFGMSAVFMDVLGIPVGTDFPKRLEAAVGASGLVLALIGPSTSSWLLGLTPHTTKVFWPDGCFTTSSANQWCPSTGRTRWHRDSDLYLLVQRSLVTEVRVSFQPSTSRLRGDGMWINKEAVS